METREQCFNSTLVQLKEPGRKEDLYPWPSFNSTLVQLKVFRASVAASVFFGFNSTLVQLKVGYLASLFHATLQFQFYLSSIKSKYGSL